MQDISKENKKNKTSKKNSNKTKKKNNKVQFAEEEAETHRIAAIPLEHKEDVYYSRQELLEQRQEVIMVDVLAQPPQAQRQQQKKKKKKKKKGTTPTVLSNGEVVNLSKKQKWQLQHIRAINERRACFRKWVYIRNRCYIVGAIGYAIYYYINYVFDDSVGGEKSWLDSWLQYALQGN